MYFYIRILRLGLLFDLNQATPKQLNLLRLLGTGELRHLQLPLFEHEGSDLLKINCYTNSVVRAKDRADLLTGHYMLTF